MDNDDDTALIDVDTSVNVNDRLIEEYRDDDDYSDDDDESKVMSLRDRMIAIKLAVRKATEEASESASRQWNDTNNTVSSSSLENIDPNASLLLGMELFSQDPSVLERKIQEKLQRMENELQDILKALDETQDDDDTITMPSSSSSLNNSSSSSSHIMKTTATTKNAQEEMTRLAHKIDFLKACSQARVLLDESITASWSALTGEPNVVVAAQRLVHAQQALQNAESIVSPQLPKTAGHTTNETTHKHQGAEQPQHPEQEPPSQALLAAYRIVDSILNPIRRQRLDLIARATSLLDDSIVIHSSSLAVKVDGEASGGVAANSRPHDDNEYVVDYSSGFSNVAFISDDDKKENKAPPASKGLSAAFQVLAAFDDQGNAALHEVIRKFTKRLYEQVLVPALNQHRDDNKDKKTNKFTRWIFQESTTRSDGGIKARLVAGVATTSTQRCLEWRVATDESASQENATADASSSSVLNIPVAAWKETFAFLQHILGFVQKYFLLEQSNLTLPVGKLLFGKPDALPASLSLEALGIQSRLLAEDNGMLTDMILELMDATCVPSTHLTVEQVQALPAVADQLRQVVLPFEQFLVEASFLPPEKASAGLSHSVSRLGRFVQNLEKNYVDKRRCTILNEARAILLKEDYHNTIEVGVEVKPNRGTDLEILDDDGMSVFKLHKCCISRSSSRLMDLCRQTMDEAVAQSTVVIATSTNNDDDDNQNGNSHDNPLAVLAPNLYRTARDILDLFRALIPSALGQEIARVPRTAALLHNDCVFFSHNCLTLGLEYKDLFPAPNVESNQPVYSNHLLRQTCMFVDMVPPFRELANQSMGDMLALQKNELVEIVGNRIAHLGATLPSNTSVAEWSEAETALTAGIYHLRHLSQTWRPILSQQVFSRSMGHLADTVFALYLEQIVQVSDISQSGCHFVSALFDRATRSISALLNDDTTGSRLWNRFAAVGSFMDMSLADVELALAQGVFRDVTGMELSRLIKATFADTEKRRNLLRLLVAD